MSATISDLFCLLHLYSWRFIAFDCWKVGPQSVHSGATLSAVSERHWGLLTGLQKLCVCVCQHTEFFCQWTTNLESKSLFIIPHSCMLLFFNSLLTDVVLLVFLLWLGKVESLQECFWKRKMHIKSTWIWKAVYFSVACVLSWLVVRVLTEFSVFLVSEDVLMNVAAYCMFSCDTSLR